MKQPHWVFVPILLLALLAQASVAEGGLSASYSWGSFGRGPGQFDQPFAVAVSPNGVVYVTDPGNYRIQAFTTSGAYLFEWGSAGTGPGQFSGELWGIAVTQSGDVLVTDHTHSRVQRFTSNGTYLSQFGTSGSGAGQLDYPYGIALDAVGTIYVADYGNNRVQSFTDAGAPLASFMLPAGREPIGVAVGRDGAIYATSDGGEPLLFSLSQTGANARWFSYPGSAQGVAVGPDGIVYVANTSNCLLQAFRPSGEQLGTWGRIGSGVGEFLAPIGVAATPDGNVFVVDRYTNRVTVFVGSPTSATKSTWGRIKSTYK